MNADVWGLVLAAAIGHALWNFAAYKVAGNVAVLWLSFASGILFVMPLCAYIWWQGTPLILSWPAGLCLLATGVFHGLYFALLARAYEHGEISTVYPIARGSGVGLTAFVAYLSLGEDISLLGAGGIALVFAGILCVGAPALKLQARGLQLALSVGLTIVCYSLIDKIGVGIRATDLLHLRHVDHRHPHAHALCGAPIRYGTADDGSRLLRVYYLDWCRLAGDPIC